MAVGSRVSPHSSHDGGRQDRARSVAWAKAISQTDLAPRASVRNGLRSARPLPSARMTEPTAAGAAFNGVTASTHHCPTLWSLAQPP
jgi:hypothetical protein